MTNRLQAHCAAIAAHALSAYADRLDTGIDQETVTDLVCDLGHWCAEHGIPFLDAARTGIGHWAAEQADPESIEPAPNVAITVASPRV